MCDQLYHFARGKTWNMKGNKCDSKKYRKLFVFNHTFVAIYSIINCLIVFIVISVLRLEYMNLGWEKSYCIILPRVLYHFAPFMGQNDTADHRFVSSTNVTLCLYFFLLSCNQYLTVYYYGNLYVTLCFVIWRFDFGVLTFYFEIRILSFLLCVLCTMLFILNGAIYEVKTRHRRKDRRKTKL